MTFWPIFAGVISANLLTVMFVWSCFHISKREQSGEPLGMHIGGFLMPLLFGLASLLIALDSVPGWLDAALQ